MAERERVLRDREVYVRGYLRGKWGLGMYGNSDVATARRVAEAEFPLPTRTVPTVRPGVAKQAKGEPWWYRVREGDESCWVARFRIKADALAERNVFDCAWPPEDQPTVAALLLLPLTEEVEDTGEEGDT